MFKMELLFSSSIFPSIFFEKRLDNYRFSRYNGKAVSKMLL